MFEKLGFKLDRLLGKNRSQSKIKIGEGVSIVPEEEHTPVIEIKELEQTTTDRLSNILSSLKEEVVEGFNREQLDELTMSLSQIERELRTEHQENGDAQLDFYVAQRLKELCVYVDKRCQVLGDADPTKDLSSIRATAKRIPAELEDGRIRIASEPKVKFGEA